MMRLPPQPRGRLVLGNMPEFNRDSLAFISRCAREYGDVVRTRFFYVPAFFLFNPADIEYVLATNNRNFIKSLSLRSAFFRHLVGNGLVTSEGEFWRRQRRLAQPAFHRDRIRGYGAVMVECIGRHLDQWRDGEERDIHREMMALTRDIVVRTLFSADVSAETNEITEALDMVVQPFARQATLGWILNNRLPTPAHRRFQRTVARLDRIVYRMIAERRASGEDRGDLLSMLLRAQDEDGTQMTDLQLRDEVMTLFLAGHETTALTLTWSWYLLAKNPHASARLFDEVTKIVGDRPPAVDDVPRLRYTEMIARETMRLYPPAFGVGREALADCRIGGYDVPRGTQIFMFQWVVHRDPRFFADPLAFRPERWEEESINDLPKYAYFPFGGGPRGCIGNTFAMMESTLALAALAQRFRFTLAPDQTVELMPAMSLRPRDGVRAVIEKRMLDTRARSMQQSPESKLIQRI